MSQQVIGVNPEVIRWARQRLGYSQQDIASAVGKSVQVIRDWESGVRAPTYVQLEKLADKCKRPIALFSFLNHRRRKM